MMGTRVRLALLLIVSAVCVCASLQEPPQSDPNPISLTEAIADYNREPDVAASVIRLYEPGPENKLAPVRTPRQARQCTIVNNQRKCRPVRPGFGSAVGRPGKETQDV